ncbi:hypothetical protein, partial [Pseudomonas aeruginosa]
GRPRAPPPPPALAKVPRPA